MVDTIIAVNWLESGNVASALSSARPYPMRADPATIDAVEVMNSAWQIASNRTSRRPWLGEWVNVRVSEYWLAGAADMIESGYGQRSVRKCQVRQYIEMV